MQKKYTLITGASVGIGKSLAAEFASHSHNLILVARRKELLAALCKELEEKYSISALYFACDLCQQEEVEKLCSTLIERKYYCQIFINNAGFGDVGAFIDMELTKAKDMLNLNCMTLMRLSYWAIEHMRKNKEGCIINVASTAAFQSLPYFSLYSASKHFVLSFSEAISMETKKDGIHVMSLCPGPTESDFHKTAGVSKNRSAPFKASSQDLAKYTYRAYQNKNTVAVHGVLNNILVFLNRLLPRYFIRIVTTKIFKKICQK